MAPIENAWHTLKAAETGPKEFMAEAIAGPESPWFDGHFNGMPILPGIAQLALVVETLRSAGGPPAAAGFSKVRFRQLLRPGDRMEVSVTADAEDPGTYRFRVVANGRLSCTGMLAT